MTTDRELFQQALDVLLVCLEYPDSQDTINALRKRLAHPEQEPVPVEHCLWARNGNQPCSGAQQKPVALSDVRIFKAYTQATGKQLPNMGRSRSDLLVIARAIEAAHNIKEKP